MLLDQLHLFYLDSQDHGKQLSSKTILQEAGDWYLMDIEKKLSSTGHFIEKQFIPL